LADSRDSDEANGNEMKFRQIGEGGMKLRTRDKATMKEVFGILRRASISIYSSVPERLVEARSDREATLTLVVR
jgi:hypothetical protein